MKKGILIKGYKLTNRLGRGAVGEVWEVEKDGQSYAMKGMILDEATTKTEEIFVQQIQLNSPFVVKYIESFRDKEMDQLFVIMEFCKRGDLAKLIDQTIRSETIIRLPKLMRIFTQILLGLRDFHSRKILHRDLNPHNIFIDDNYITKIGDFGTVKFIATMGQANSFIGTPGYISPEIYEGKPHDESTDMWSLGVIMYQLASLSLPWKVTHWILYSQTVVTKPITPLMPTPDCPAELVDMIHSLLHKDPKKRANIDDLLCNPFIVAFARRADVNLFRYFPPLVCLLVEAREENRRLTAKCKKLRKEKQTAVNECEREKAERASEMEDAHEEIERLTAKCKKLRKEKQTAVNECEREKAERASEMEDVCEGIGRLTAKCKKLQKEKQTAVNECEREKAEKGSYKKSVTVTAQTEHQQHQIHQQQRKHGWLWRD